MFQKVDEARFIEGEHEMLRLWRERDVFRRLQEKNAGGPRWSFLDGPITANNPMGVHHAWGRTYKDAYQRYFAMTGHELRYQNGFDCQGLWVEVEVEKELGLGTKTAIARQGIDTFVRECKKRVLRFAARQTEQSVRLGYWMEWDDPDELRKLAEAIGAESRVQSPESSDRKLDKHTLDAQPSTLNPQPSTTYVTARGQQVSGDPEEITARLGNPEWGGSYFTFSTENNETIWTFLKKCFDRGKIYLGHDVMPWGGRAGTAYSQMEVADGRRLTTHRAPFVRFPIIETPPSPPATSGESDAGDNAALNAETRRTRGGLAEYLLVWTTTPWTLTSNVACAVNPDLEYVRVKAQLRGDEEPAYYYFAKDNLEFKRLEQQFKEGFGRHEWQWPDGVPKLKTIAQIFKEQGGYEVAGTLKGTDMIGWRYAGPFDDLEAQRFVGGYLAGSYPQTAAQRREVLQVIADNEFYQPPSAHRDPEQVDSARRGLRDSFRTIVLRAVSPSAILHSVDSWTDSAVKQLTDRVTTLIPSLDRTRWTDLLRIDGPAVSYSDEMATCVAAVRELAAALPDVFPETGVKCHRVIDGGRDSKGNPYVVAGEGTGIVHTAPGCGDVDYKIGQELGLVSIAPLQEDGSFGEGFGPFTGRKAVDPETADLVFEELKRKGLFVAEETYPHIYPHCWRTGEELVFRLVDEWFINMDWREEIKEVTRCIEWLPESIQGEEREVEWLSTMRDWMISKKRFWGLALPIWANPDDPTDFKVVGDLDELKRLATDGGEGWEQFEGHTPHRPWIDAVKIPSDKHPGQLLTRVEDVGNPWLDAGITPFSTMHYNHDHDEWQKWFPADFVTECFPGQFRNWFYSLLALSTMMRYDETDDPQEKRPFKTLLGHRLVMDEHGNPMHKSDGTAIWFEEAAEQLGVDTLRWMYLAQNPAADLRFGTRHPDEPVELTTPEGHIRETKEGLTTCRVTSRPANEIRRQVLIPLWNSYAFFANYAVADEFDPTLQPVPLRVRPEIDRWILSRLQELTGTARQSFEAFDVDRFMDAAAKFIDDLSNWYIRRNRRRFWRSREKPERFKAEIAPGWESDKLAAYQTLYDVLVTLAKLLAPCVPFLSERMYQNLVVSGQESGVNGANRESSTLNPQPMSVHLCKYPEVTSSIFDPELNWRMQQVQRLVRLGHRLRESTGVRVRQPLEQLYFACADDRQMDALMQSLEIIHDELNVKGAFPDDNLDQFVKYSYKPNLKTLGPKYGKLLGAIRKELPDTDPEKLSPLRNDESVTLTFGGEEVTLTPEDVLISTEQASDWACGDEGGIQAALSTALTPGLIREGMARDFVRHVQQARKEAGLEITDRIHIQYATEDQEVLKMLEEWTNYIESETLADSTTASEAATKTVTVGESKVAIGIKSA